MPQPGSLKSCPELNSCLLPSGSGSLSASPHLAFHKHISTCTGPIQNRHRRGHSCWSVHKLLMIFSSLQTLSCGGRPISLTKIKSKIIQGQIRSYLIFIFSLVGRFVFSIYITYLALSKGHRPPS